MILSPPRRLNPTILVLSKLYMESLLEVVESVEAYFGIGSSVERFIFDAYFTVLVMRGIVKMLSEIVQLLVSALTFWTLAEERLAKLHGKRHSPKRK